MDADHINCEESIGKTVGRRTQLKDPVRYAFDLQKTAARMSRATYPRGIFKFRSHEEADQWMIKAYAGKTRS